MSSLFDILAERRIAEAIARGELDNLPGAGRPLEFEEEPFVSPEQRMCNRILRNAGLAPPELLLRKEIAALRDEIAGLPPGERLVARRRELARLLLRLAEKT